MRSLVGVEKSADMSCPDSPQCFLATIAKIGRPSGLAAENLGLPGKKIGGVRLVVGRYEWVRLPGLGVGAMNAKTDSGARSSSLHAEEIERFDGGKKVRFMSRDHFGVRKACEVEVGGTTTVKSSNGGVAERVWVETDLELPGGFVWRARLTLADRTAMRCPILLGRRCLAGFFLVDVKGNHLCGGPRAFS